MSNFTKDDALRELKKVREHLLNVVNTTVDALIARLENGDEDIETGFPSETVYPLSIMPSLFKGTKPNAVIFGKERIAVKTWREAYSLILRWGDDEKHDALMELRNKIAGRSRTFLSDKPDGMDYAIKESSRKLNEKRK